MMVLFYEDDDEGLFLYFHEKYKKLVYKYVYDILKNHQDTEDAMQIAWIKFASNIRNVKNQSEKRTINYIITIVKNVAINIYNKKTNVVDIDDENLISIVDNSSYDDIYMIVELDDFKEALKKLDKEYINPLLLKYTYGYSIKEIAELLHMTETNVGTRIYRAKILIKEKISERRQNDGQQKNER